MPIVVVVVGEDLKPLRCHRQLQLDWLEVKCLLCRAHISCCQRDMTLVFGAKAVMEEEGKEEGKEEEKEKKEKKE